MNIKKTFKIILELQAPADSTLKWDVIEEPNNVSNFECFPNTIMNNFQEVKYVQDVTYGDPLLNFINNRELEIDVRVVQTRKNVGNLIRTFTLRWGKMKREHVGNYHNENQERIAA